MRKQPTIITDGETMKESICKLLKDIEQEYNITILYACEAGSRAWGLHHEQSDYDIRFIFVHPIEQYLMINKPNEVIEIQRTESIEIVGWDLRKALELFNKQNPSLIEWLHSTIIYVNKQQTKETLLHLHRDNLRLQPLLHHYVSMSKRNVHQLLEHSVKQSIHVIRPLLICEWLINYQYFPPMNLCDILTLVDEDTKSWMMELIGYKKEGHLQKVIPIEILTNWATSSINKIVDYIEQNKDEEIGTRLTEELNHFLRKMILGDVT